MSHRTLAALAVPAALILPLAVHGVADAAPAAITTRAAAKPALTAAQRARLHRLHVLHLRTLANLRAARAAGSARARVVKAARSYIGTPYVYGGASRAGTDCAGLTQQVYAVVGKHLPRTAAAQGRAARRVARPLAGDLVFWRSGGVAYHVAIYAGSSRVIVARHTGTRVQYQALWGSPTFGSVL